MAPPNTECDASASLYTKRRERRAVVTSNIRTVVASTMKKRYQEMQQSQPSNSEGVHQLHHCLPPQWTLGVYTGHEYPVTHSSTVSHGTISGHLSQRCNTEPLHPTKNPYLPRTHTRTEPAPPERAFPPLELISGVQNIPNRVSDSTDNNNSHTTRTSVESSMRNDWRSTNNIRTTFDQHPPPLTETSSHNHVPACTKMVCRDLGHPSSYKSSTATSDISYPAGKDASHPCTSQSVFTSDAIQHLKSSIGEGSEQQHFLHRSQSVPLPSLSSSTVMNHRSDPDLKTCFQPSTTIYSGDPHHITEKTDNQDTDAFTMGHATHRGMRYSQHDIRTPSAAHQRLLPDQAREKTHISVALAARASSPSRTAGSQQDLSVVPHHQATIRDADNSCKAAIDVVASSTYRLYGNRQPGSVEAPKVRRVISCNSSIKRRRKAAMFSCDEFGCSASFTAAHNLRRKLHPSHTSHLLKIMLIVLR
ncbi:hypothetical protein V5O48_001863 [Marasmius crinis-equi]|uniref:C2H2-type domain-containing protein n=1 Tax=Marasmius crinis-equi TaxID=585013 RepID=A0ABR3FX82_9AGAR